MSVKKKKLSPFMRRKAAADKAAADKAAADKAAAEKARQIAERDRRIFGNNDQW